MHAVDSHEALARKLEDDLIGRFGMVLPSSTLVKVLGYASEDAYHQALTRKTMPVPVFQMPSRRGYFALAMDVASWLATQRQSAAPPCGSAAQSPRASAALRKRKARSNAMSEG
jgi:hypothetical protein